MNQHVPSLFRSFWMAGFESSCHINRYGARLDMIASTQHDRFVDEDYARLLEFDMRTARDTMRWHLIERRPGVYDFSSLQGQIDAARRHGVEVIWDLCHYGWPDDLDVFAPQFVDRFANFSKAATAHIRASSDDQLFLTPVNEISFLAWAAGEVGWFHPHGKGRGPEVKRQLIRAAIASIEAIWSIDPKARIVAVDPLIHVVPPKGEPDVGGVAAAYRASQFEAWDMLAGLQAPELGGHPKYLDIMGVNFYHDNQWEHPGGEKIHWHIHPRDPRWVPFSSLLADAYARYRLPIFIAETSHVGVGRAEWIRELSQEICLALERGVPLEGVCLYPILDRFEWNDPTHWHNSGLWDYDITSDGTFRRVLNEPYAEELRRSQKRVADTLARLKRLAPVD
jgi:beta-glucosidase/6-phospho-beta-glucosidase/beta-galactosidase